MFRVTFSVKHWDKGINTLTKEFKDESEYNEFIAPYIKSHLRGKIIGETEPEYF